MDFALWVNIATLGALVATPFFLKAFFGKYFEKKGENQALREDIHRLTELAESARSPFIKQAEVDRTELALLAKHISATRERSESTLAQFFETVLSILARTERTYATVSRASSNELSSLASALDQDLFDLRRAYFRVVMFCADHPDVVQGSSRIVERVLDVEPRLLRHLRDLVELRGEPTSIGRELKQPNGDRLARDATAASELHKVALNLKEVTAGALSEFVLAATVAMTSTASEPLRIVAGVGERFLTQDDLA
jgi:hypothetical protein